MTVAGSGPSLHLTQIPEADDLLVRNPFALLVGLLLDQQFPMERALAGPYVIAQRTGRELDSGEIAGYDPEQFAAVLSQPPAVHRFPGSMAGRIQKLAEHVSTVYEGDAARIWNDGAPAAEVVRRLEVLPGFGKPKARIFLALLGKQLGIRPDGWREVSAPYGEDGTHLSLADVVDQASLELVRASKKEKKAAKKAAASAAGSTSGASRAEPAPRRSSASRSRTAEPAPSGPTPRAAVPGSGVAGVRARRPGV